MYRKQEGTWGNWVQRNTFNPELSEVYLWIIFCSFNDINPMQYTYDLQFFRKMIAD